VAKKIKIKKAIRPNAPTDRVATEVFMRHDADLKCTHAKIEYNEISGKDTASWRVILTEDDASKFATAWKKNKGTAVTAILSRGDLLAERH